MVHSPILKKKLDDMNNFDMIGHRGEQMIDAGLFNVWVKCFFGNMNNRKIKFRICYTAQNGERSIIYNDDRYLITLDGKVLENYGNKEKPMWEEIFDGYEPPILQQYTGLIDSKGKEIYEGDVVKVDTFDFNDKKFTITDPVVWGEYGDDEYVDKLECWMIGGYPLSSVSRSLGLRYNGRETDPKSLEVIKNIYE